MAMSKTTNTYNRQNWEDTVRDSALKMKDELPKSDVKEFYIQNMERELARSDANTGLGSKSSEPNDLLMRLARTSPYYKRNRPHVCSFWVKGECRRGEECPYRHEKPTDPDDPLADQNIKDRYYGINDPVADKLLKRAAAMPALPPPEDKTITTLYIGNLGSLTEQDIRDHFYQYGEIRSISLVPKQQCAFVQYTTRAAAENAAEKTFNKLILGGRRLTIKWGRSQGRQGQTVGNPAADMFEPVPGLPGTLPELSNNFFNLEPGHIPLPNMPPPSSLMVPPAAPETNIQDLLPRVDISSQITESLIDEIADKNWKVRNEALTKVSNILTEAKLIKPNIGDLPHALALRLVDSNGKIAQTALNICENIATAMGQPCKQYVRALLPGFLQCLADSKAWIRSAAISCMNSWGELCAYKEFFESEMIADALKTGSPNLRSELWLWLSDKLPKIKSVPKDELVACIPHLYGNLEDRNADVRKNAQEAVLGVMMHLSYESMVKQTDKLKPGSKTVIMAALDKARPNLPVKPLAKGKQLAPPPEEKAVRGTKPVATSKNAVKPKGASSAKASSRKKEEDIDTSPLMTVNNLKNQRTIDENKLRVLKWNFTTPREEFVELLKEQMITANINKTLIANMFHSDFRYHIKAIDSLMEDLPDNRPALVSNLDLIFKWITLRFFDTNPSVLLKALEYLHSVFNMLIENNYHMPENEGAPFVPYLVLKAGDPKDAVRNGVRSLFKQIAFVFGISRLFSYVMEGLKSKNARQRAECLEVLGSLIEDYGITICLPSPAICLKEIAKQISDRDNAVRSAALNCIVQAYFIIGEKVLKMVGQISDKDMTLLEERIRRAKRPPPKVAAVMEPAPINVVENTSARRDKETNGSNEMEDDTEDDDDIPGVTLPTTQKIEETSECTGPFKLDDDVMKELENMQPQVPKLQLEEFDMDFLDEEITVPSLSDASAKVTLLSPPAPILPNQSFSRASLGHLQSSPGFVRDLILEKTIRDMGSPDVFTTDISHSIHHSVMSTQLDTAFLTDAQDVGLKDAKSKPTGKGSRARRTDAFRKKKNSEADAAIMAGVFARLKIKDPTAVSSIPIAREVHPATVPITFEALPEYVDRVWDTMEAIGTRPFGTLNTPVNKAIFTKGMLILSEVKVCYAQRAHVDKPDEDLPSKKLYNNEELYDFNNMAGTLPYPLAMYLECIGNCVDNKQVVTPLLAEYNTDALRPVSGALTFAPRQLKNLLLLLRTGVPRNAELFQIAQRLNKLPMMIWEEYEGQADPPAHHSPVV